MLGNRLICQIVFWLENSCLIQTWDTSYMLILHDSLFKSLLSYIHECVVGFQDKTGLSNTGSTQGLVTVSVQVQNPDSWSGIEELFQVWKEYMLSASWEFFKNTKNIQ